MLAPCDVWCCPVLVDIDVFLAIHWQIHWQDEREVAASVTPH